MFEFLKMLFKALNKRSVTIEDVVSTDVPETQEKPATEPTEALKESPAIDDGLMHVSDQGLREIVSHEGIVLSKYKDSVGVWTIGIGATKSVVPDLHRWPDDKTITVAEAFELFRESVKVYENAVRKTLKVSVPQHTFDALVSWCYNVGTGWPRKATVVKLINSGIKVSDHRIHDALMRFRKPKEIIKRRRKEADLLCFGKYSGGDIATLFKVNSRHKPYPSKQINLNDYIYRRSYGC